MANGRMRLRFLAMERSLRATGCDLPLWVIPYDDEQFELPANSSWWELSHLTEWLREKGGRPKMRKYQCLTIAHFQFVDADVCFLRNPVDVMRAHSGFVTSCCHWHNPNHTTTEESKSILSARSTTWQKNIFNSGQFACDRALYSIEQLKETSSRPDFAMTCLRNRFHEQSGMNLLVAESRVEVANLTLPPTNMESTWAGDYHGDFLRFWKNEARMPYLIHWAGTRMGRGRPIDQIFHSYLTDSEKSEWDAQVRCAAVSDEAPLRRLVQGAKCILRAIKS